MSEAFAITLESYTNLPLVCYWFMDEEDGYDYVFDLTVQPYTAKITDSRLDQMRKRLNARCKGLLEVRLQSKGSSPVDATYAFQYEVDFLHRTVKDFLAVSDTQKLLGIWQCTKDNINLKICSSIIALIKTALSGAPVTCCRNLTPAFFHHVKDPETVPPHDKVGIRLVNEFATTLRHRGLESGALAWDLEPVQPSSRSPIRPLLECIRNNIKEYVETELRAHPSIIKESGPNMLRTALVPSPEAFEVGHERVDMLRILLEHGADPNEPAANLKDTRSAWEYYVSMLVDHAARARRQTDSASTFDCCKALLIRGATAKLIAGSTLQKTVTEEQLRILQDIAKQKSNRSKFKVQGKLKKAA